MQDAVETVARAFYYSAECARGWDLEPERLKEKFRKDATMAIFAVNGFQPLSTESGHMGGPLPALPSETVLETKKRETQTIPGFVAVLSGPKHVFHLVNQPYRRFVGPRRRLIGRGIREAFPDLDGQSFFDLLDRVFETREPFIGASVPIKIGVSPEGKLRERFIDLVYKPIQNANKQILGILVEGRDVTQQGHWIES